MRILVINGPNLNMLGKRESEQYGTFSLKELQNKLTEEFREVTFNFFQSNIEGEIISEIQNAPKEYDAVIINPGGYAHTSVAIKDALDICKIIKIEVHLSHLSKREEFRHNLITSMGCDGYISGFKENSYSAAVFIALKMLKNRSN